MTTTVVAMAPAGPGTLTAGPTAVTTTTETTSTTHSCPGCGLQVDLAPFGNTQAALLDAQKQISDLQAQVRLLNQKATAAVDRWADYEDELARLRSQLGASRPQTPSSTTGQPHQHRQSHEQLHPSQQPNSLPTPPSSAAGLPSPSPSRASFLTTGAASRISALLTRKSPPVPIAAPAPAAPLPTPTPTPTTLQPRLSAGPHPTQTHGPSNQNQQQQQPSPADLLRALSREQALRREAEGRLTQTSREVEELSASLFEQANEMVATERRARAALEARVGELERRESEKRGRLERLERAVGRIERVRGVLADVDAEVEAGRLGDGDKR
ncbi:putative exosome 3 [Chaetomium sp. MPI-SDFR-AT-0129]|nr:putative exosome 3 [Chaetomium sp. MPI-SDFR-AT-0129]